MNNLAIRAALGEFEEERPHSDIDWDEVGCERHRELNLRAAERSLVLLEYKNKFSENKKTARRIAVIGPCADSRAALVGNYCGRPDEYITVLEGVRRTFPNAVVRYAEGSRMSATSRDGSP